MFFMMNRFVVIASRTFVDFENVKPADENPVEYNMESIGAFQLDPLAPMRNETSIRYSLVESRVTLEDSLIQLFTEPKSFSLLNLDPVTKINQPFGFNYDSMFNLCFELGQRVSIEKRVVLSIPSLFGEVGGLYDFLSALNLFVIGGIQAKLFQFN